MLVRTWNGRVAVAGVPLLPVDHRARIAKARRLRRRKHGWR
jgi:hypothetical protein